MSWASLVPHSFLQSERSVIMPFGIPTSAGKVSLSYLLLDCWMSFWPTSVVTETDTNKLNSSLVLQHLCINRQISPMVDIYTGIYADSLVQQFNSTCLIHFLCYRRTLGRLLETKHFPQLNLNTCYWWCNFKNNFFIIDVHHSMPGEICLIITPLLVKHSVTAMFRL